MDQDLKNQMVVWKEEVKQDHQDQGRLPRHVIMLVPEADLDCPECSSGKLRRQYSQKLKRFYYRCNQNGCDGYIGAHPDGSPLGIPATQKIRKKRQEAHDVFDLIWKRGFLKRTTAYRIMAEVMGIDGELHIANLDLEGCERLIKAVNDFLDEERNKPQEVRSRPLRDPWGDEEDDEAGWITVSPKGLRRR